MPVNPTALARLVEALPPDGANPLGKAARDLLVVHVRRSTPGFYPGPFGPDKPFSEVFFPRTPPSGRETQTTALTGLGADFFGGYAAACLCHLMTWATSEVRQKLDSEKIDAELADRARTVRRAVSRWYAETATTVAGPVHTALAAFTAAADRRAAATAYLAGISTAAWVNEKCVRIAADGWPERDWEMFHHWTKISALGGTDAEIDTAISAQSRLGLPVPGHLAAGAWRGWSGWLRDDLSGHDVAEATAAILQTRSIMVGGRYPSHAVEGAGMAFIGRDECGRRFHRPPSSSCFAPGTMIRMADGDLRDIAAIGPGDEVATPAGPRRVLLRPSPARAGRTLVRLAGTGFGFAATHPFVLHDPAGPRYAAADPDRLTGEVPLLARLGLRPLAGDQTGGSAPALLSRYTAAGPVAHPAPAPTPAPDLTPDRLYDLFLDTSDARHEYYAGDASAQFLVSAEVPRYDLSPLTASAVLRLLERTGPALLAALSEAPDEAFADLLSAGLSSAGRSLLPAVGPQLWIPDAPAPTFAPASTALAGLVARLVRADGHDQRLGILVEQVAGRFAAEFEAAIEAGWRHFPDPPRRPTGPDLLGVTVYGIEFTGRPCAVNPAGAVVEAILHRGDDRTTATLTPSGPGSPWWIPCHRTAYLPRWHGKDGRILSVRVTGTGGTDQRHADLAVPAGIQHGYRSFKLPLQDRRGRVAGWVTLDLRTMDEAGHATELARRAAWTSDQRPAVAHRLADLAAGHLERHFTSSWHRHHVRQHA